MSHHQRNHRRRTHRQRFHYYAPWKNGGCVVWKQRESQAGANHVQIAQNVVGPLRHTRMQTAAIAKSADGVVQLR